jgi:hypothetical protein
MGQAKNRKRQLGELYGTPKGSNFYVAQYFDPRKVRLLSKNSPAREYLTMSREKAQNLRVSAACMHLGLLGNKLSNQIMGELPRDFVSAFIRLFGHCIIQARQFEDWDQIAKDLHTITTGKENIKALATWPYAVDRPVSSGECDPRHACYALLQGVTNMTLEKGMCWEHNLLATSCLKDHKHIIVNAIPDHLISISCIEAGFLLHRSGSLYLFDQACDREREKGRETLWLTRLRPDGIYAMGPMAQVERLRPSEIKGMRKFVLSYTGPRILGELNPGRERDAGRLCKAIGLTVDGKRAWIGK